jgi:carbon storage regulator
MLILSRRANETIMIGDDIALKIIRVDEHQIRIGIEAPKEVTVRRGKVAERIEAGGVAPDRR